MRRCGLWIFAAAVVGVACSSSARLPSGATTGASGSVTEGVAGAGGQRDTGGAGSAGTGTGGGGAGSGGNAATGGNGANASGGASSGGNASGGASSGGNASGGASGGGNASGGGGTGGLLDLQEIEAFQRNVMKKLTGVEPVDGTTRLTDRASPENRKLARDYIVGLFNSFGLQGKILEYTSGDFSGGNPYGEIPSTTGSAEWIVGGGRFDTLPDCPGANLNASGAVAWIAVARYLVQHPHRSKNILVTAWDGFERGFSGSKALADWIRDRNLNIHSVHGGDELGWDGPRAFSVTVLTRDLTPEVRSWYSDVNLRLGLDVKVTVTGPGSTDDMKGDWDLLGHRGFRALGLRGSYNPDTVNCHPAPDSYDTIHFDYLALTTRLIIYTLQDLVK